jgi:hypothetical protein
LPSPSTDAAALRSSNGTLFLLGGNNGNVTNQVVSLSPGAASWNKAANLDQERTSMGVGFLPDGNIAVFGADERSTQ